MEILDFMNTHENWEEILTQPPYCITVKRDGDYILLKYNQYGSDFSLQIVRECRGSIFYKNKDGKYECVCRAFDKFGNVGESYVSEIDWSSAVIEEKVDGCFSGEDCVMLADGTKKKIKDIVNKKLDCEVLSYNFNTKQVEPKKIIGWNKSRKTRSVNDWMTIYLDGVKSTLHGKLSQHNVITPTKNHMIFRKNNGTIEEVMACELCENDIIYTPVYSLTNIERQVALGTLLGDGSLTCLNTNSYCGIRFCHSVKQHDYVNFKAMLLSKIGGKVTDIHVDNSYGKNKTRYMGHTHPEYSEIYKLIYDDVTKKKKVTVDFLEKLDWLGFAIWYMDDGSLQTGCKNNSIHLHTEGFSKEDVSVINRFYNNKGYKNYIQSYKGYYIINFSTKASERIWENIRIYIPECMQYKLPERHHGFYQEVFDDNIREILLVEKKIKKIENGLMVHNLYDAESCYCYDIEVEGNHNYFCQGILVHNSLIKTWNHDNKWHVSTNGTINAYEAEVTESGWTFGRLFDTAIENMFVSDFLNHLDKDCVYMFELVSPRSRVTISYPRTQLYYLGCRNMRTMREFKDKNSWMTQAGIIYPKVYKLSTLEDCLKYVRAMTKDEEGFVIRDKNFNRMKLKSPEYLLAFHMNNNGVITTKRIIKMMKNEQLDDFVAYCPEHKEAVDKVLAKLKGISTAMDEAWKLCDNVANKCDRVVFSCYVAKMPYKDYLYKKYDNHELRSMDYILSCTMPCILRMLERSK